MPIYLANLNEDLIVSRITGSDKLKKHLENIGVVVGETVRIVNKVDENLIIKVKGISMAIGHELARRIII